MARSSSVSRPIASSAPSDSEGPRPKSEVERAVVKPVAPAVRKPASQTEQGRDREAAAQRLAGLRAEAQPPLRDVALTMGIAAGTCALDAHVQTSAPSAVLELGEQHADGLGPRRWSSACSAEGADVEGPRAGCRYFRRRRRCRRRSSVGWRQGLAPNPRIRQLGCNANLGGLRARGHREGLDGWGNRLIDRPSDERRERCDHCGSR